MEQTYVEELLRQVSRFAEEKADLSRYLDELTTDGAGLLYELKLAVGADSDLGQTIASLGGAVRRAANNGIHSLDNAYEIMAKQCEQLSSMLNQINMDYSQYVQTINAITFK